MSLPPRPRKWWLEHPPRAFRKVTARACRWCGSSYSIRKPMLKFVIAFPFRTYGWFSATALRGLMTLTFRSRNGNTGHNYCHELPSCQLSVCYVCPSVFGPNGYNRKIEWSSSFWQRRLHEVTNRLLQEVLYIKIVLASSRCSCNLPNTKFLVNTFSLSTTFTNWNQNSIMFRIADISLNVFIIAINFILIRKVAARRWLIHAATLA